MTGFKSRECDLSPDLVSLFSEPILREIKKLHRVVINGRNINNTRYADDTVLIVETEKDLQRILNKFIEVSKSTGMSLNVKKTYMMMVSNNQSTSTCKLTADGKEINHVDKLNHLGSFLTLTKNLIMK